MSNEKPSWDIVIPLWWAFFWRATLFGILGGAVVGGIAGGIMGATGHVEAARTAGQMGGYIASVPVSLLVLRHVLSKRHGMYSIQFVKNAGTESA
jgi:hypothetical protein